MKVFVFFRRNTSCFTINWFHMPAIFQADYSFWQGIRLVDSTCSGKDLNRKHGLFFFVLTKSILFSRHEPIAGVIFSSGMERVGVFNSHTTFVWLARVFVTEQSCSLGITVLISHAIGKNLRSWQKSSWDEAIYFGEARECHHLYDKPIILFGLFWCRCCFF